MINNGFEERSEDRRIRKTKKALRAALVRLLSKESIAEITIKELTDEADVHRGTFYHHYPERAGGRGNRAGAGRGAEQCAGK